MLSFDMSVSGGQISRALSGDLEEAAYFFKGLIEDAHDSFGEGVAEYLDSTERQEVAAFLILLAGQIGGVE
jgi:hypothetical protein